MQPAVVNLNCASTGHFIRYGVRFLILQRLNTSCVKTR